MTFPSKQGARKLARISAGVILGASLGLIATTSSGPQVNRPPTSAEKRGIEADFWYEVSDPRLIIGESLFVVMGTAEEELRIDGNRTVFRVTVDESFKGQTPQSILVSQLGSSKARLVMTSRASR